MNYKLYDEWLIKNGREPDLIFPVYEKDLPEKTLDMCKDINTIAETQFDEIFSDNELSIQKQNDFFEKRNKLYRLAEIVGVMDQVLDFELSNKDNDYKLIITDPKHEAVFCEISITELQYIILCDKENS